MQHLSFFVWLISVSLIPSRFIHGVANGKIFFFVWLDNIPLCVCMCTTPSLSVEGHLGCFHGLTFINNASMKIGMHISFQISFLFVCFLDIHPGMELLGHTIVLLKGFLRNPYYFPQWPHQFIFPLTAYEHLLFPTSLPQLCSFWWQPFWKMWGDISLWFWFAFPSWLECWESFHVLVGHLHFHCKNCLFISACHLIGRLVFLILSWMSCLCMLTIGHIICKHFLPFSRLSFHFVNDFLSSAKDLKFD